MKVLVIAAALALPLAVSAQTTASNASAPVSEDKLVQKYTDLAGSEKNSKSLVDGLRGSKKITLTEGRTTTTFDPPTQKMGFGNVNVALALAEASLREQGIRNPTPAQLRDALMGTRKTDGILQMRADGMGWGQIARKMDFKVGDVVKAERVARAEKPERPVKVERPDRPERPSRPDKPERPGK